MVPPAVLKLAPGIRLSSGKEVLKAALWKSTEGKVHLNRHALAVLELCDGSRSRDRVVIDALLQSAGALRAADVIEFLDAASSRGWLIETP
jgi:hypothetical protein